MTAVRYRLSIHLVRYKTWIPLFGGIVWHATTAKRKTWSGKNLALLDNFIAFRISIEVQNRTKHATQWTQWPDTDHNYLKVRTLNFNGAHVTSTPSWKFEHPCTKYNKQKAESRVICNSTALLALNSSVSLLLYNTIEGIVSESLFIASTYYKQLRVTTST